MNDSKAVPPTVKFKDWTCTVMKHRYSNGRVALNLVDEEGPVAASTVNLPDIPLGKNEVCIKDHSENLGMLAALEAAGLVKPTGQTVRSGFVEVPVCELLGPLREASHEARLGDKGKGRSR